MRVSALVPRGVFALFPAIVIAILRFCAPLSLAAQSEAEFLGESPILADLVLNGEARGNIEFFMSPNGIPMIPSQTIRSLLTGIAKPETIAAVAQRERLVAADELRLVGIRLAFDASSLLLAMDIDPRSMIPADLSIKEAGRKGHGPLLQPEPFAAILGLSLKLDPSFFPARTSRKFSLYGDLGIEPSISALGFVGMGSVDLVYSELFFLRLNEARLVRDFPALSARLAGGLVATRPVSFQGGNDLLGFAFYREEGMLGLLNTPNLAIDELILERNADIAIEVNGITAKRLKLAAGSYRLSDLPLTSGLNDVVVKITEAGEAPRSIRIGVPFDPAILETGKFDYAVTLGMDRTTLSRPFGAAYLSAGTSPFLELGTDLSLGFGSLLAGFSGTWASPIGSIAAATGLAMPFEGETALSVGWAAKASWRFSAPGRRGIPRLGLAAEYRSKGFAAPRENWVRSPWPTIDLWHISGQIGQSLPGTIGSLGLFGDAALVEGELYSFSIAASLFINLPGSISLSASVGTDWLAVSGFEPMASLAISLMPPDRRSLQYRHDLIARSDDIDIGISFDEYGKNSLALHGEGLVGESVPFMASVTGRSSVGGFDMGASAFVNEESDSSEGSIGGAFSTSASVAYARGRFAAANSFGEAFAILVPSASIAGQMVELRPWTGPAVDSPDGKPTLISGLRPYRLFSAAVEMPGSAPDIRPNPEIIEFTPTYRSVTIIDVGIAHSMSIRGRLVDAKGRAVSNLPGDLIGDDGEIKAFSGTFTDENGVFECYGIEAGEHTILWGDGNVTRFAISSSEERVILDLGEMQAVEPDAGGGGRK